MTFSTWLLIRNAPFLFCSYERYYHNKKNITMANKTKGEEKSRRMKIREIQNWIQEDYLSGRMLLPRVMCIISIIISIISIVISVMLICSR